MPRRLDNASEYAAFDAFVLADSYPQLNDGAPHDVLLQPLAEFHFHANGEPWGQVFPVSSILRSVHLLPLLRKNSTDGLSYKNVLDDWRGKWVLSLFSDQHMFRTFFPPLWYRGPEADDMDVDDN